MADNTIGVSAPGASSSLAAQVNSETDEQRKRRLQQLQASRQLPVGISSLAAGYGSALALGSQ
jgi:hypothetical protein